MRHTDLFLITEAQRRAERFECEVEHAHLLAQLTQREGWRYRAAEGLLRLAARLEPQPKKPRTPNPC